MEMFEEVSEQMNAKIECTYPDKKFNVIYWLHILAVDSIAFNFSIHCKFVVSQ